VQILVLASTIVSTTTQFQWSRCPEDTTQRNMQLTKRDLPTTLEHSKTNSSRSYRIKGENKLKMAKMWEISSSSTMPWDKTKERQSFVSIKMKKGLLPRLEGQPLIRQLLLLNQSIRKNSTNSLERVKTDLETQSREQSLQKRTQ
jgi:hypothetical protein